MLPGSKGHTPSEKGLHRQLVGNNTARDNLEEMLIEIHKIMEDTDTSAARFNTAHTLKLKQLLRAALKENYKQKMFLLLATGVDTRRGCLQVLGHGPNYPTTLPRV